MKLDNISPIPPNDPATPARLASIFEQDCFRNIILYQVDRAFNPRTSWASFNAIPEPIEMMAAACGRCGKTFEYRKKKSLVPCLYCNVCLRV